ncbi:hypothetical protein RhiLY_11858 [Ceratobasidium sp. AG-Ba]|nr:hypothetical protein RhiLY_11858 [Ceratobasidium sp. AG-Ba]
MGSASYSELSSNTDSGPTTHSTSGTSITYIPPSINKHSSTTIAPAATIKPTAPAIPAVESRPATTSTSPNPTLSPGTDNPQSSAHSPTFNIILDSGKCASLGIPSLTDFSNDFSAYELAPLGDHQFTASLTAKSEQDQAFAFMVDGGERCGALKDCLYMLMSYGADGMKIQVIRVGNRMYPFSIWMDGGRQPNGALADSQTSKYNCWGWSESECPLMLLSITETYAVSSSVAGATVHITFCPEDGPDASSIGPSNTTIVHVATVRITEGVIKTETFTPVSTFLLPLTGLPEPRESLLHESISPIASIPVPTTLTDSLGRPTLTSIVNAAVLPTFSMVTEGRGSAVGTVSYNLTTFIPPSPTSPPETVLSTMSWTTYMTIEGSTVPAIGGQVGILTTISETYVFEENTMLPLKVYSSISAESTRSTQTSLPSTLTSSSAHADLTRRTTVIVATVGSLVGITLVSVLVWAALLKHSKRKSRTPDYAECQPSMWSSRSAVRPSPRGGSTLDLDREPEPRASFIEPWTEYDQAPSESRKIQREMEERGGGSMVAGPSRGVTTVNSSREHAYSGLRSSKSADRIPPQPLPEPPARAGPLLVVRLPQEPTDYSPPAVTPRPLLQSTPPPMPLPLQPHTPAPQSRYEGEPVGSTAIPPTYNEAWNIRRDPTE